MIEATQKVHKESSDCIAYENQRKVQVTTTWISPIHNDSTDSIPLYPLVTPFLFPIWLSFHNQPLSTLITSPTLPLIDSTYVTLSPLCPTWPFF